MTLMVVALVSYAALVRNQIYYYAVLVSPAVDLVLASLLARLSWRPSAVSGWARWRAAIIFGLLLLWALDSQGPLRHDTRNDYVATLQQLEEVIDPNDLIIGSQTYWFGRPNQPYLSWQQLVYYQRYLPGATLEAAFQPFRPDVLMLDEQTQQFINDDRQIGSYFRALGVPRADLAAVLAARARLVGDIETPTIGEGQVYRFAW